MKKTFLIILLFGIVLSACNPALVSDKKNSFDNTQAEKSLIQISETDKTLCIGETADLKITTKDGRTVKPKWTSDSPDIVSVSSEGKIKAQGEGTTSIRAVEKGTPYFVSCKVTVKEKRIQLTPTELTLSFGETKTLAYKVLPGHVNQTVIVKDTPQKFTVTAENGRLKISPKDVGEETIVLALEDDPTVTANLKLTANGTLKVEAIAEAGNQVVISSASGEKIEVKLKDNNTHTFKLKITKNPANLENSFLNLPDWITHANTADIYTFTAKENKAGRARSAEFVIKPGESSGNKEVKIHIFQEKNPSPKKIVKWIHGITPPPSSELEKNFGIDYYWHEDGFKGWFNVNKIDPNSGSDSNMCWAMTASSMLQWWAHHNKDNINKYLAYMKSKSPAEYAENEEKGFYDLHYTPSQKIKPIDPNAEIYKNERKEKSGIGNTFRREFSENTGGDAFQAMKWFLKGETYNSDWVNRVPWGINNKGLVGDVFSDFKLCYTTNDFQLNRQTTNDFLKDAVTNKRAVGLNRANLNGAYRHVITVWGIAFEDLSENGKEILGDVIGLYVADNDHPAKWPVPEQRSNSFLIYYGVGFKNDNDVPYLIENASYSYLDTVGFKYKATRFFSLDLGEKAFKKYLQDNKIN